MDLEIYNNMLTTSLITAFIIIGITKATEEGYILEPLKLLAEQEAERSDLVRFILTPVVLCCYCMSSVWTIIIQLQIGYTSLISLCGSIFLTLGMVVLIKSIIDKHDN